MERRHPIPASRLRLTPRRLAVVVPVVLALAGVALLLAPTSKSADEGEVLRASSVCEAHELKALREEDPDVRIEIPAEFDQPWPSRAACLSYEAASDEDAPGPLQPIPFSHKHHAGLYEIDCQYCHSGTDRSPAAGVPSVQLCMGCHGLFPPTYDQEFEGIRKLKEHWERRTPIEWEQIHRLPEYVQFKHNRHVAAGVACEQCHGPVRSMHKVYLVPDTKRVNLLPAAKLKMGWCLNCHWQQNAAGVQQASDDCLTCHY